MDDLEFDFEFESDFAEYDETEIEIEEAEIESAEGEEVKRRSVQVFKTMSAARKMRLLSEAQLDEVADWNFEPGTSYHFLSFGDIDSLSYLRLIARQQNIRYLCLATWCIAREDLEEIKDWVARGIIGRIDFYVGEFTMRRGRGVAAMLNEIAQATGGRVCRFFNHSKVMVVFGERFDCVVEGSANVNTNPRCENMCITVDSDLAHFYKRAYDVELSFDAGYSDWEPFEPDGCMHKDDDAVRMFYMLIGAQASGKSTYADDLAAQGVKVVSTDALREIVNGRAEVQSKSGYVHEQAYRSVACFLQDGFDVALDATNVDRGARRALIKKIRWLFGDRVRIVAVEFDAPLKLCLKRNRARSRTVPENKLKAAYEKWRSYRPSVDEGFDEVKTIEVR